MTTFCYYQITLSWKWWMRLLLIDEIWLTIMNDMQCLFWLWYWMILFGWWLTINIVILIRTKPLVTDRNKRMETTQEIYQALILEQEDWKNQVVVLIWGYMEGNYQRKTCMLIWTRQKWNVISLGNLTNSELKECRRSIKRNASK